MKTVIATTNTDLERYIISTHQDILVLAQEKDYNSLKNVIKLHKPQLLIMDEAITGQQQIHSIFAELRNLSPDTRILFLFIERKPTPEEEDYIKKQNQWLAQYPMQNHQLSQVLYSIVGTEISPSTPAVVAVWSPKAGDGATITTEAIANLLRSNGVRTGVYDFNLKSPYLKLRYGFDDCNVIDDLLPFIAGDLLNAELLFEYLKKVKEEVFFLGGIRHPELHGKYNATHFNKLLEVSKDNFTHILIDAGSTLDNIGTITGLKNADLILAVMQPNYISKCVLKDVLRLFPAYGINPNKVKLVINRYVPEVFDSAEVITAGLNLYLAGTLPELGPEANIITRNSLFEDKSNKKVISYNQAMLEILKDVDLCVDSEKSKKTTLFPKLLTRR